MGKQQAKPVLLVTPSIKQEASHMIYAMATHNIPRSAGVGLGFYSAAQNVVKKDVMLLLQAFHYSKVDL